MPYIVKFTPVANPQDSIEYPGAGKSYDRPRQAWHALMELLEFDMAEESDAAKRDVMDRAHDAAYDLKWNEPGIVPVSFGGDDRESFVYGVIQLHAPQCTATTSPDSEHVCSR